MAAQRTTSNPKAKSDGISSNTLEKAQTAKDYIERKYKKLKKVEQTSKIEWEEINTKLTEMHLSNVEQEEIKQEIMHKQAQMFRRSRQKMTVYDFESVRIIGKGAFGEVRLVRRIATGEILALKKIDKNEMIYKNQLRHVKAERDVLVSANNPWVVTLKFSFQDEKYLYLVMEYLPGGDFMSLLIRKQVLTEDEARFYISEAILAVEFTHKLNYIHRDLKPDNLLIDANGHLKLTDFGLSKHFDMTMDMINPMNADDEASYRQTLEKRVEAKRNRNLAFSTVGTPDYIAPEVFSKQGYCETVDWWSIGVILFEMLVGYTPFFSNKPTETCHKIVSWQKHFKIPNDARLSVESTDLIRKLIAPAHKRLGNNGVEEIKAHPFFRTTDWNDIRNTRSPMIPDLKNELDTSNFEIIDEAEPFYPPAQPKKKKHRRDPNFVGFTYKRDVEEEKEGILKAFQEIKQQRVIKLRPMSASRSTNK